ncbi:PREDICTED: uncharacterized protein LOC107172006 [Diuraphis noxia]|uniref:uncharacterized protein LOC107172006 n=1 Tax=Diuraphis noxia TaxID=143948 RepID=UPI00076379E8|nr:PREDICTED: uncharacterized protein LOC107172006 [Diuraphis noxia]
MSPNGCGKSRKRAKSVEDLLETTAQPDSRLQVQAQMKKAKSLEEYLDTCEEDAEDSCSVSASVSDSIKKKNFVNKCINKMKSFITATKKTSMDSK